MREKEVEEEGVGQNDSYRGRERETGRWDKDT